MQGLMTGNRRGKASAIDLQPKEKQVFQSNNIRHKRQSAKRNRWTQGRGGKKSEKRKSNLEEKKNLPAKGVLGKERPTAIQ